MIKVIDAGTDKIDLSHLPVVTTFNGNTVVESVQAFEYELTEIHYKSNGAKDGHGLFVFVVRRPGYPAVFVQVSKNRLRTALGQIGLNLYKQRRKQKKGR